MNGIILYQSKYGATKKYVDWLTEETGFDIVETKKANISDISKYDIVVLAGGIYASGIAGLSFLKKNFGSLKNKIIAVLCVGASPYDQDAFSEIYKHNFKNEISGIKCFYARGTWDEEAMSFKDRTLCRMLQKAVAKQDPSTYQPWQKALMCAVGQKCDWTDKRYLDELVRYIKE
ncbi:MAG: flavodoxin domain-containing protein [Oscillospiraceae bacterium]|nr:flavodoxin domain-containing protein [Oscillospiraceae bacterium]